MRKLLLLLTFVLSFCFASGAEARKLALLIGVDDYINVPSLKTCVKDALTLKEALMKVGFNEDDIHMLVTDAINFRNLPTKRNIEKNISLILCNAQPSDTVFLAFFGHGIQEGKTFYFCPPDIETDDPEGTCVSINKVMDLFGVKCQAKFKLMVVDACHNGSMIQGTREIGAKGLHFIPTPPEGVALFLSCSENEKSCEDPDSGNSFFIKNFAAALSGEADSDRDGKLTLLEVCTWTSYQTKNQVWSSLNQIQRPCLICNAPNFVLIDYPPMPFPFAEKLIMEGRKALDEKDYESALEKFNKALKLKHNKAWELERDLIKKLIEKKQTYNAAPKSLSTSRSSFEWDGSKITKFIGQEKHVVIPDGATEIGNLAFLGSYIESIVIPDGVTKIGAFAFSLCRNLKSIDIGKDVSTVEFSAFCDCRSLKTWRISLANPYLKTDGIALLTKDGKKLISCPAPEGKYTIPEGVTEIEDNAFFLSRFMTSVVIPKSVKKIGNSAFNGCKSLTFVVIPEGVEEIGNSAFELCSSLTSAVIPKSVTTFGNGVFSGCSKLTIYAPARSKAEEYAKNSEISFQINQDSLDAEEEEEAPEEDKQAPVVVPAPAVAAPEEEEPAPAVVAPEEEEPAPAVVAPEEEEPAPAVVAPQDGAAPKLQATSRDSFEWKGTVITKHIGQEINVVIPDGTTEIGTMAFFNFEVPIESVVIPDGVTEIGFLAFANCRNLKSIDFGKDLSTIGQSAFMRCQSLRTWRISPDNPYFKSNGIALLSKDGTVLVACPGADGKYRIPEGVTVIGNDAFCQCKTVTSVVIPKSVTKIGDSAFNGCRKLTHVVIPEGVTEIGKNAFDICVSLTSIVIPKSVTTIGDKAFASNDKLTIYVQPGSKAEEHFKKVGIPYQVIQDSQDDQEEQTPQEDEQAPSAEAAPKLQTTSRDSFEWDGTRITKYIGNETEVFIPEGTTEIGFMAFTTIDSSVESVVIPNGVTKIDKFAFSVCKKLSSVSISKDVSTIGKSAFTDCPALKTWRISPANPYFKSDGIALLTKDGKKLVACPGAENKYKIPEGVTVIGDNAFSGCKLLDTVVIPKGVKVIGNHAFDHCRQMTYAVIPEGAEEIGYNAFDFCSSLTSIVIPESVTKIGDNAFSGCSALTIYAPAGSKAEEYAKKAGISFQVK